MKEALKVFTKPVFNILASRLLMMKLCPNCWSKELHYMYAFVKLAGSYEEPGRGLKV